MTVEQANKSLYTVMLVVLFSCAGVSLPYPILAPLFLNEITPLTTFANLPAKILLGIVLGVYPLGMLIGSSIIGGASDLFGRKRVLTISLILSALGYLFSALALVQQNYPLFVITRFLTGLCEGNISIAKAIAIDLSAQLDKTRTFSLINATGYAGWLIGPLAGGLLQPLGSEVAFWIASLAIGTSLVFVRVFLPANPPEKRIKTKITAVIYQNNSLILLKNPQIRKIFYIYLSMTLGINAYYAFYPVFLVEQFHFNSPQIGYITALITGLMIISSISLVTLIKRFIGLITGALVGMALIAVLLLSHPLLNINTVWPVYALIGAAIAIYNGMLPVYISEHFANVGQGQLMGLLTTTFSLGNMVMAMTGSIIALLGAVYPILVGAILILIAMLGLSLFARQQKVNNRQRI
jgi:predicted MFS family arabinose efflux permease